MANKDIDEPATSLENVIVSSQMSSKQESNVASATAEPKFPLMSCIAWEIPAMVAENAGIIELLGYYG